MGRATKNPFQFYFSKEIKEQYIYFLKLCLSLTEPATIWEGFESFQNFLSIFLFKKKRIFFLPWLSLGLKGGGHQNSLKLFFSKNE
jgi:hypothetical protein